MTALLDVYWSFRSPYSYLAGPQMLKIQANYNVRMNLRIVLPLALRDPSVLHPENAHRGRYIMLDWPRRAEFLGMPHAWPSPDPVVQNLKTLEMAAEQPHIYRLSQLGVEAQRRERGIQFAAEVSRLIFGGTRDWHLGMHLADAAARAGLDLEVMEQAITDGDHMTEIETNQDQLQKDGHWGVPTFVFDNEPFFGQDRIDTLSWRLDQKGLRKLSPDL